LPTHVLFVQVTLARQHLAKRLFAESPKSCNSTNVLLDNVNENSMNLIDTNAGEQLPQAATGAFVDFKIEHVSLE
jgi:hypothetical protein